MSTDVSLILAGVFVFVVAPLSLALFLVDWRKVFGMAPMEEVRLRRRFAQAHEEIGQVFAAAGAKMQRRSGEGDPFGLGGWRKW